MKNPFVYRAGGVLSADIAVPQHERELAFYSAILTTGQAPLWRDDLMNNLGNPIIGLGARTPEYDSLPLQWMPHFQVADIAASVEAALAMGGKQIMLDEQNRWAVLADADGSAFGLIPVVEADSSVSQPSESFGCIAWLSLNVPDAVASRDFYQRVIGWSTKSIESENSDEGQSAFAMHIDDETTAAEICQTPGDQNKNDGIPPVWLIHLPVADLAASLQKVAELGGQVIKGCAESGHAVVRDPVGVCLALQAG